MSGGQVAMNVLAAGGGGVMLSGRQVGMACVVQLTSGAIVWCQKHTDGYGELRTSTPARVAVYDLLGHFFPK
jgi:hypothetical protein